MKKLLFLLALSLCSLAAWAYSFSAVSPTGQTLYYNITSSTVPLTVEVTNALGTSPYYTTKPTGNLTIPSLVTYGGNDYSVTSIGTYAFQSCSGLTSVTIPNSVTSIGYSAFSGCSGLKSVTIPNSVTTIGNYAFSGCSGLKSVTIPDSVTSIGSFAFYYCSGLTSVTIPNSVTTIGSSAFAISGSGLTNVNYTGSIAEWCGISFGNASSNPTYYAHTLSFNGTPMGTTLIIPDSVTSIGSYAFNECSGLTSVTIGNSVTTIGERAFYTCLRITSVIIGNSVTSIGSSAFEDCIGLTSVTIPNSVTSIESSAFYGCSGLTSVTIPNSVTSIGSYAFKECSGLTSITIPNSVTTIGQQAFYGCRGLTSITIPNSVTSIGSAAFSGCSGLTSVTIPNSVTSIGSSAFDRCSGLTSVTIPNSVTSIGSYAFKECSGLTSVTIGNSVTTIGERAFYICLRITSVIIGNSVTSIGSYAFDNCSNLKTVYNLSSLSITKGSTSNGRVAYNANRVVKCTEYSGSGDNIIYKIPTTFTIVDNDASTSSTEIPYSTIPTNFIYYDNSAKDGGSWKAKNIVLTDGQDAFEAPETFTAETATYTREFTNSNRSTLYLPFTAAIPENFEVYDFTSFANNTISFTEREDSIYAYTPYLVGYDLSKDGNTTTCTITKTNAVFPKSESANYHPVTRNGMTFQGVLERTEMTSTNNYGYSNGFFVQSGGHAHVNPFRSYFTYTAPAGAPQSLPPTLNVEVGYGDPVGIDAVETPEQEYDGRYGKDVYDMLGRLVRKNAENLDGLPRGIYLWKGKKFMNYE